MKERVILHSDLNNFYASVECFHNPDLRGKAVAVCGDAELRHGIVLAKNYIAKSYGIKTGDVIWEAKQKCPQLIVLSANFDLYLRFSKMARKIYERYTDRIEAFGVDECWLDITGCDGQKIANEIRERIKDEMGVTASVGVSWNKIFAKLGSDMKKPDATTIISKDNFKDTIFKLPASDLLYVGKATDLKLSKYGVQTIGDIARTDVKLLKDWLGKWGEYIWTFANGYDVSPVMLNGMELVIKSVGNSTTAVRDLENLDDVRMIVTVLSESVASRLREQWFKGQVVSIYVRDKELLSWGKQAKIDKPTFLSKDIIEEAMKLFRYYNFSKPIRSIGIKVSDLSSADSPIQLDIFTNEEQRRRAINIELSIDDIRRRFGYTSIGRGIIYLDKHLTGFNPKTENVIHPYSYFR